MRPKDLKSPFLWRDRKVLISDRVWYVPSQYDRYKDFVFPGWNHPELFGNDASIAVEYCSGNGDWIVQKALEEPEINWVAVEKKFDRVRKIWSKIKNFSLQNLIIICGDAQTTTAQFFPDHSIKAIYINFPDPWPKLRHAKHRVIQPAFLSEMQRVLKKESDWEFVTDDQRFGAWTLDVVKKHASFQPVYAFPHYITSHVTYGSSYFDTLWREQGKTIQYYKFSRS